MTLSLRPFTRSRRHRPIGMLTMGVLAWLMLVINAWAAAPMGMTGVPHAHPMHPTVSASADHCTHQAAEGLRSCCGDDQGSCCGGTAGHACHCGAMCSSTMAPPVIASLTLAAVTVHYAMPLPRSAPSVNTAPPLRPPAA